MRGLAIAAATMLLLCAGMRAASEPPALVVIVHPTRIGTVDREEVTRIFRGRQRFWGDGSAVVPLNLPAGTPLRERFSRLVLHEDSAQLATEWNEQYFHGLLPPAVLASSDAVKRYVAYEPRAIGYVE